MTQLTLYDAFSPHACIGTLDDFPAIAAALASAGARLERWDAGALLPADASDADILVAYADPLARLQAAGGYQSRDVVRLTPDHPARIEMRAKFLAEHIHDDDEVRFFVEGSGLFYIRHDCNVLALECTRGDLIAVPAGTRHWFDTGERPLFTAIRLFTRPDGWVARFTGDAIAQAIPLYAGPMADSLS